MNFYGIRHDKTTAIFYKAVHKIRNEYISDYDPSFKYVINRKAKARGFDNSPYYACAEGIHISHLDWALNYGEPWLDLAIIEVKVKIKDIVLPNETDGKVRVPEAEVIREVPLEECGVYGKILAKRREREVSHG